MRPRFASTVTTPPGGAWFWEDRDHWVSSPSYGEVVDRVRAILAEQGDPRSPEEAIAEYMCPRMPPGFCSGFHGPREDSAEDYLERARPYAKLPIEMAHKVAERLETCLRCPMHRRTTCLTCRGIDDRVRLLFDGRRAILPQDRTSGVCAAAGTYAMAVASVRYPEGSDPWEGTPRTCWRFR